MRAYERASVRARVRAQEDRRRNIDAGKNIFHLAAEALQKLDFADAGKILPTRGQKIFNSAAE